MIDNKLKELSKELNIRFANSEFSKKLGFSKGIVSEYLNNKKRVSQNFIEELENYYKIDYQEFLKSSQEVHTNNTPEVITTKSGNVYTENEDGTYTVTVSLVPFDAYASYVETLESEVAIIEDWEKITFNVEKIGLGKYLGFRSKGDSMDGGLINDTPDKSLLLGRELGRHHWLDGFNKTKYGWIIVSKYNIMHKDIIGLDKETGTIRCHSRNKSPEYQDFDLKLNDVYQILKVIKRTF